MPGNSYSRASILALFLCIGMLPPSHAGEPARTMAQHLRAHAYVRESGKHPDKRAQAMRYTRMVVLRAKCELHTRDKRRCARYMTGPAPKPAPKPAAPAQTAPAAGPPAVTAPPSPAAASAQ